MHGIYPALEQISHIKSQFFRVHNKHPQGANFILRCNREKAELKLLTVEQKPQVPRNYNLS